MGATGLTPGYFRSLIRVIRPFPAFDSAFIKPLRTPGVAYESPGRHHPHLDDLTAELTMDCTRAGGQQTPQTLTRSGTYTRLGPRITLQVPGAPPLTATITSDALAGTLPASPVTFPIDLMLIFARLLPA